MSVVGQFPLLDPKRRIMRSPINPLDKATVVSIFPREIREIKPTIQPGVFIIPPGSNEKPGILTVGPSSWWHDVDENMPLLEIPSSSVSIAESIIKDYCNGLLGFETNAQAPGLFYVAGELTSDEVKTKYKTELEAANMRQKRWYGILLRLADSLWARSNGNPITISDDMRLAARELGQKDKDWMRDFAAVDLVRCQACGALKNPDFPVCGSCRNVDMSHPKAKDLKFAS